MATEAARPRVVFLPASRWSRMALDIHAHLRDRERYAFHAIIPRLTPARLAAEGFGKLTRKLGSILAPSRGAPPRAGEPAPARLRSLSAIPGLEIHTVEAIGDPTSCEILQRIRPDLCINTGGCGILRKSFLDAAGAGVLNLHSGLPRVRGFNAIEWQVYHGLPVTLCAHLIDTGVDTGPVILSEEVRLPPDASVSGIREGWMDDRARLLARAVEKLVELGPAALQPQDPDAGRQFFALHADLRELLDTRLARDGARTRIGTLNWADASTAPDLDAASLRGPSPL